LPGVDGVKGWELACQAVPLECAACGRQTSVTVETVMHRSVTHRSKIASLIETCKLHNVNPEAWLADVLTRLVNGWPNRRLAELMPWAWKAARNTLDRVAA
jgi:hypothetical protein